MALGNDRPRNGGGVGGAHADLNVFMAIHHITYKTKPFVNGTALLIAATDGRNTMPFTGLASVVSEGNRNWKSYDDQNGELIATGTSQFDCIRLTIMKRYRS